MQNGGQGFFGGPMTGMGPMMGPLMGPGPAPDMMGMGNMMMYGGVRNFNPFPCTRFWDRSKFEDAADNNWNVAVKGF